MPNQGCQEARKRSKEMRCTIILILMVMCTDIQGMADKPQRVKKE